MSVSMPHSVSLLALSCDGRTAMHAICGHVGAICTFIKFRTHHRLWSCTSRCGRLNSFTLNIYLIKENVKIYNDEASWSPTVMYHVIFHIVIWSRQTSAWLIDRAWEHAAGVRWHTEVAGWKDWPPHVVLSPLFTKLDVMVLLYPRFLLVHANWFYKCRSPVGTSWMNTSAGRDCCRKSRVISIGELWPRWFCVIVSGGVDTIGYTCDGFRVIAIERRVLPVE